MLDSSAIESLAQIVGQDNLLTSLYDLDRYSADALNPSRAFGAEAEFDRLADLVVRPGSTEEVSRIVVQARQQGTPLVPYGGGTGVMGGTLPVRGGIIVDMGRMNRVLEVRPTDLTAQVEAGIVLQDLVDALAEHGLMPGHDPYSVPIATLGGAISTNGVGYRAAAYGPMGDQVVGLEVVLPDGRVLTTRSVPKYSSGPNLNQLFIGSEGTFGIITQATIRAYRRPEAQVFATASFDSFDHGFNAAGELLALGIHPALLDLTEEDDGIQLHLLFEGFQEGVAAQEQRSMQVCAQLGGPGPRLRTDPILLAGATSIRKELQAERPGQATSGPLEPDRMAWLRLPAPGIAYFPGSGVSERQRKDLVSLRRQGRRVCHLEPAGTVFHVDSGGPGFR